MLLVAKEQGKTMSQTETVILVGAESLNIN